MRAAWFAVGMLGLTLVFGRTAPADGAVGCCACTFCTGPSFCGEDIADPTQCDMFCNAGGMCMFHTVVADVACSNVPVCPQSVHQSPVGAPAMSAPVQLVLLAGLGTFGYSILKRRS